MGTTRRWPLALGLVLLVYLAAVFALYSGLPVKDGVVDWFAPLIKGGWMAWTLPVALFFWIIASLLVTMTLLAIRYPETPRVGVLRIETTRGDRLFISLLGSAFIHLIWLFFAGTPVWPATVICLFYAAAVFRWV